jgi:hypothetical protein
MSREDNLPEERTPYERFRDLAKQVLNLPPEELQRRQAEWKTQRKKRKKNSNQGELRSE